MKADTRRDISIDAVYDLEASQWDKFICGGLWSAHDNRYRLFERENEKQMAQAIKSIRGSIWAHVGGRYDHLWLMRNMMADNAFFPSTLIPVGSRIVIAKLPDKTILYDSNALFPISLEKLTSGHGVKKQKLNLRCHCCARCRLNRVKEICGCGIPECKQNKWHRCDCKRHCGGYCALTLDMREKRPEDYAVLVKYQKADVISLRDSLQNARVFAESEGLDLGATVGGSAWRNLSRKGKITKSPYQTENETGVNMWRFVSNAYFGGIVGSYMRGMIGITPHWFVNDELSFSNVNKGPIYLYDINATYPSVMSQFMYPVGNPSMVIRGEARRCFEKHQAGIYHAIVISPDDQYIPVLPYRTERGKRIYYPTGQIEGYWTEPLLRYAIEECGYKLVSVINACVFPNVGNPFRQWVKHVWGLRSTCRNPKHSFDKTQDGLNRVKGVEPCDICKDDGLGEFLKFYCNSPYGKTGSDIEHETWLIDPKERIACHCPCARCGKDEKACKCGTQYLFPEKCLCKPDKLITDRIIARISERVDDCSFVHWAAYITSYAHIKLRRFQRQFPKAVIYSDTDSCYTLRKMMQNVGKNLGQWGFKGLAKWFECFAPKVYDYELMEPDAKGETHKVRSKGVKVPKGERPKLGRAYHKHGVKGFRTSAKGDWFEADHTSRILNLRFGDRPPRNAPIGSDPKTWHKYLDKSGLTRPLTMDEIEKIENSLNRVKAKRTKCVA